MSFFGSRGMREGVMERDPSNEWIEATNLKLFKVEPKFEATAEWAQFNVETVNALDDGRDGKPELRPAAEVRAALLGLTKQFYAGGGDDAPAFFGRGVRSNLSCRRSQPSLLPRSVLMLSAEETCAFR